MQINPKRSSQHIYDYVVVGSGLSGLLVTSALSRATSNILLIEASDTYGGLNHAQNSALGLVNNGLRFLPDSSLAEKSVRFLNALLEQKIEVSSHDNQILTFESGALRPFVGFGDAAPAFYEELAYFLSPKTLHMSAQPFSWLQGLFEKADGDFLNKSHVTRFHVHTVGSESRITSATINGQKTIHGHNFIYCGNVQDLQTLLPEEALPAKARQRLSKAKYWTAVCLDLLHTQMVTESSALHVLNGASEDEFGPCVGQFSPANEGLQLSQWVSFVDNEDAEDTELVGQALKKIKRQIKRAYPQALEALKFERILVAPAVGGHSDFRLSSNQSLPNCPNFWVSNGTLSTQKNLLGSLQQAELVTSALGFHPQGVTVEPINEAAFEAAPADL
jgi:glycine/D-amino acid oxidase-like deaminating enzyme